MSKSQISGLIFEREKVNGKAERMKEAGSFWESMGERGFPSVSFGPRENAHRG
jgi:hypothetical protein